MQSNTFIKNVFVLCTGVNARRKNLHLLCAPTVTRVLPLLLVSFGFFAFTPITAEAAIQFVGSTTASGTNAPYNVSLTGLNGGIGSAPVQDDIIIVTNSFMGTANGNPGVASVGYTELADLYVNDTNDANVSVNYVFATSTPVGSVRCNGSPTAGNASTCLIMVFRGVDLTTPMDVSATTTASVQNNEDINCPSITPITAGSYVVCAGGAAGASVDTAIAAISGYTHAYIQFDSTNSAASVAAYKAWVSGAEDPAAFVMDLGTATANSWGALTMALRPAPQPPAVTISGTLFSDEGTTPITSGKTIALAVSTTTTSLYSTTSNGSGVWSISIPGGNTIGTSTPVVVWVDADVTTRAATFTKASSTNTTISGVNLYQNRVIVRHEASSGTSTTNANMAFYDGDDDSDIQFTSNGGALTVQAGNELHIWTGDTFAPGGAVTVNGNAGSGTDGSFHIPASATYTTGGNTTLAGSLIASSSATFTPSTYTLTFNATTTGKSIDVPLTTLGTTTFNGVGGGWTLSANATTSDLTITNGTVVAPTTLAITGNYTNNGSFTDNAGTVVFNSASAQGISGTLNTAATEFASVQFIGAGTKTFSNNASTTNLIIEASSGAVTAPTYLSIAGTYTNSGTFTPGANTVLIDGAGAQSLSGTLSFNTLTFANGGIKTMSNNATTSNLTINTGVTLAAPTTLAITGNYTNNGSFTDNAGTVVFNSASAQGISGTLNTAATEFASVQFIGAGTKTFSNNASTTNLTINTGSTVVAPTFLSVGGDYLNSGTFTAGAGTTTFSGTGAQSISGTLTGTSAFNHVQFTGAGTKALANVASTLNFVIDASSGAVTAPSMLSIYGNYRNASTFTHNSGTVVLASSTGAQALSGTLTDTSGFSTLTFTGAGTKTFSNNASTTNLTINAGATVVAPANLSVTGNYTNNGSFTHNSGTVLANGTGVQTFSGTLSGASTFNNFRLTNTSGSGDASQSLILASALDAAGTFTMLASTSARFLAGATSTLQNLAIQGSVGQYAWLRSSSAGTRFTLSVLGTDSVTYVDVKDSNACPYTILGNDGTSVDSGNNTCWSFTGGATTISSVANQVFMYGQATTTADTITIAEGASPGVLATADLRLIIATTSANMRFDTSITNPIFGGTASGKVSSPVTYLGGGQIMVVPVDSDFGALETLTISGLAYSQFGSTNPAVVALGMRISGVGTTSEAFDDKTTAIKGSLTLAEHTSGQIQDNLSALSETQLELHAFKLTPAGENATISSVVFGLDSVTNISSGDLSNFLLYRDVNSDKVYGAGDVAVGGSGALSLSGLSGTVTFSTSFIASTTQNYILIGDTNNIYSGDSLSVSLGGTDITAQGTSSLMSLTLSGSVTGVEHRRGGQAKGGGRSEAGGSAPAGDGAQTGGGSSGGGGNAGGHSGETLGSEPGFNAPTSNGTPNAAWTSGANAYASDEQHMSTAANGAAHSLGNFGFSVPSGNEITGIEVMFEGKGSTAAGTISTRLSWNNGSSVTSNKTTGTLTTSDVVYSLGSPSDTWGHTWTASEFNNGSFVLEFISNVSGNTVSVDAVQVRVYHQTVATSTPDAGGGGGEASKKSDRFFASVFTAVGNQFMEWLWGWFR